MEFIEAVKFLADKVGVRLPSFATRDKAYSSLANHLYEANETAAGFYQANLANNKEARDYLKARGLQEETIKLFRLGAAPTAWDALFNFLSTKGIPLEFIEKSGLVVSNERGGYYDRFRERVIFPIFDARNKILGFGGRVLGSALPKYINSPETYIYSKGKNLYGFNFTKEEIKRRNYAIMVEGYMDLIALFQAGIKNVVATLGTALTQDQSRLLKRFAKTCVVVYDPDEAGEAASLRSLDIFLNEGISVYIATLKRGYDPDNYIRNFGVEDFKGVIKEAKNLFDYKLGLLTLRHNVSDIHGKVEIAAEMLPTIARIDNAILRSNLIKRLAQALSVDEESLRVELKKVKPDYSHRPSARLQEADAGDKPLRNAGRMLLALMLEDKSFISRAKDILKPEEFNDHAVRDVMRAVFESDLSRKSVSASSLLNSLRGSEGASFVISEAAAMNEMITDKDRIFVDCVETVKKENLKLELKRLEEAIRLAHVSKDEKAVKELVARYNELVKIRKR
jgi:DNA primase